jgi:ankyrin repeat protein|eukprot:CAMPEP_0174304346 /NCGR_PEP_ID=MMETSP0809-20121228/60733_1 /TAXON_ID=73025 ORGANISM="Eutreptiella gymnastica-like, Strain CCMP1594" /NCGR_SAMPLE_ID=MMETSP0809 /ASSEMBLY_ACC=CAM_ASM_000658 /LENGTH=138 /DNA_ID=CAMNT_0015410555 /DNA_START=62 /DNA_END=478 /DNA_ORIENTATION=+
MVGIREANEKRLVDAVKKGEVNDGRKGMGVLSLLKNKVDVNCVDGGGNTPLHYASSNGQLEVVKVLLEQSDIDVNIQDNYGRTALHWAACCGHLDIVKALRDNSHVQTQIKTNLGKTAFEVAKQYGRRECAAALNFDD